jgi:hypothetical protein
VPVSPLNVNAKYTELPVAFVWQTKTKSIYVDGIELKVTEEALDPRVCAAIGTYVKLMAILFYPV